MKNKNKKIAEPTVNDMMCDKRFSFFETSNITIIAKILDRQKKTPIIMIAKNNKAIKIKTTIKPKDSI